MHFESFMFDCEFDGVARAAAVNGAQRVQSGAGLGRQADASQLAGGGQQVAQEAGGEARHVAGDHQIPVGRGRFQGGMEATDRSAIFHQIGQHAEPQMRVAPGRADQRDGSGSGADLLSSALDERGAVDGEKRFVAPHTGAAAAGEDESRCRVHEKMVAMQRRVYEAATRRNKMVYICSLVFAMLAASPMRAADPATSSLLTPAADAGKVSVVRVDRRTGKLVRTVSGGESRPKLATIAPPPAQIQQLVEKSARAHNVDPLLVQSVIQVESNYNHYAVSPKGAEGLMQLMPGTARMLGVTNSFDPAENIEAGVKYLRYLQNVYQDDRLALAAYNAGPKAVDRYKGAPPYAETQDYVNQVGQRYQTAKQIEAARMEAEKAAAQAAAAGDTTEAAAPAEEQHPKLEQSIDQNGRLVLRTAQE
jgi:hypothetical protein